MQLDVCVKNPIAFLSRVRELYENPEEEDACEIELNDPFDFGGETLGERITRTRKERGYTQIELADKIGIIQSIVSAIERDERKLSAEMAVRFALALDVSLDELLKPVNGKLKHGRKASRRVLRRLEQIEALPPTQQTALLRTIDAVLKGNAV